MWSVGSWGGSGFAAIYEGFVASNFNWRVIFHLSIAASAASIALIWGLATMRTHGRRCAACGALPLCGNACTGGGAAAHQPRQVLLRARVERSAARQHALRRGSPGPSVDGT